MFQFRPFPSYAYLIQRRILEYCSSGFPHSEIPGSMDICSSPRLIAACHVLRRLLMPRHSPCALSSLTFRILADSLVELCRLHSFPNCNCYPHLYDVFHNFNFLPSRLLSRRPLCCLAYHFSPVQFSRCNPGLFRHQISKLNPLSFEIRSPSDLLWWARVGSNHRPYDYQSYALAS